MKFFIVVMLWWLNRTILQTGENVIITFCYVRSCLGCMTFTLVYEWLNMKIPCHGNAFYIIGTLLWEYTCKPPDFSHKRTVLKHYNDAIMGALASQITSLASVYSTVQLCADQRKHQNSASLAFVRGVHRRPVNSPHKGPVTRKMFPFGDVIMKRSCGVVFFVI